MSYFFHRRNDVKKVVVGFGVTGFDPLVDFNIQHREQTADIVTVW